MELQRFVIKNVLSCTMQRKHVRGRGIQQEGRFFTQFNISFRLIFLIRSYRWFPTCSSRSKALVYKHTRHFYQIFGELFRQTTARATRAKMFKINQLYSKPIGDCNNFASTLLLQSVVA